jgi:hypothetical protein
MSFTSAIPTPQALLKSYAPVVAETIARMTFPMLYLATPPHATRLESLIRNATVEIVVQDLPQELVKKNKATELRSKWR